MHSRTHEIWLFGANGPWHTSRYGFKWPLECVFPLAANRRTDEDILKRPTTSRRRKFGLHSETGLFIQKCKLFKDSGRNWRVEKAAGGAKLREIGGTVMVGQATNPEGRTVLEYNSKYSSVII